MCGDDVGEDPARRGHAIHADEVIPAGDSQRPDRRHVDVAKRLVQPSKGGHVGLVEVERQRVAGLIREVRGKPETRQLVIRKRDQAAVVPHENTEPRGCRHLRPHGGPRSLQGRDHAVQDQIDPRHAGEARARAGAARRAKRGDHGDGRALPGRILVDVAPPRPPVRVRRRFGDPVKRRVQRRVPGIARNA